MFLTHKRDDKVKARKSADRRKQCGIITKDEATSPTVSQEAISITVTIKVNGGRNAVVIDLPGAFLYAETNEHIITVLKGGLVEMMAMTEPKLYRKYIMTDSRGQLMLYVKIQKALYGPSKSTLPSFKKLVENLGQYGFGLNYYNPRLRKDNWRVSNAYNLAYG